MKKVLLFAAAALATTTSFAQVSKSTGSAVPASGVNASEYGYLGTSAQKTTKLGDTTFTTYNVDSILNGRSTNLFLEFATPFDSGYYFGANAFGYKGFAKALRTDRDVKTPVDSTVQFLGWFTRWGGRVQTNSTKQVTFTLWNKATSKTPVTGLTKVFISGRPGTVVTSKTVAATALPLDGSAYITYAPAAISGINYPSYIGVTFSASWAQTGTDTFGVRSTSFNNSEDATYTTETGTNDTLLRIPTYLQSNSGSWLSPDYEIGVSSFDPIIAAIVRFDRPASVKGVEVNELTVFGAFPNPSAHTANFKFSLKSAAGVKFQVYDYSGRLISSRDLGQLPAGEQIIPQNVENLPSGAYIFSIQTTKGDALATMVDIKH